jgi:6-pyruvoyltetrahydropterin/6-carboxytetrahydropterin synthase
MFKLSVNESFSAAHRLIGYDGACSNLHGHNWKVRVCVEAKELDPVGLALDFGVIKKALREILQKLDHANLNEIEPFDRINPTSENIAILIYDLMSIALFDQSAKVCEVEVCESENSSVIYSHD